MKTKLTIGLTVAMMTASRIGSAQGLTTDVGIPLAGPWNPGGAIIVIALAGHAGAVVPASEEGVFTFSSVSPGDVVMLADANGGNAPSNWGAVVRFFNPSDPTGQLGLPATETLGFFPADVGPGGFASFQLFPNYNFLPATSTPDLSIFVASESLFGPFEGVLPGQLAIVEFDAINVPVPEPGTVALLGLGGIALALNARRGRT